MDRRAFLAGTAAFFAAPLPAHAQQPSKVRIGFLATHSPAETATHLEAFRQGLRDVGYEVTELLG